MHRYSCNGILLVSLSTEDWDRTTEGQKADGHWEQVEEKAFPGLSRQGSRETAISCLARAATGRAGTGQMLWSEWPQHRLMPSATSGPRTPSLWPWKGYFESQTQKFIHLSCLLPSLLYMHSSGSRLHQASLYSRHLESIMNGTDEDPFPQQVCPSSYQKLYFFLYQLQGLKLLIKME